MYKVIVIEVISRGKDEEDKVYRGKSSKIFEKYGISRKLWRVEGRKANQVLIEFEFESRADFDAAGAKLNTDKEWQALQQERNKAGVVVEATQEFLMLTDY